MKINEDILCQSATLRQPKQRLRVTFPDGNSVCFNNATTTYLETLKRIGSDELSKINLEIGHLPLISRIEYPKYKGYMKPITDGWYVNTQSNTQQKFLQLHSINDTLQLNLNIEIGTDLEVTNEDTNKQKKTGKTSLLVQFPDGEFVAGDNPIDTFIQSIWKMGLNEVQHKEINISGKPLITRKQQYKSQIQVGTDQWIIIPATTKDKAKILRTIALMMRLDLKITII